MTWRTVQSSALVIALGTALAAPVGHAQAGRAFTTNFSLAEFAARRARVYDAIGPGALALIQGLPSCDAQNHGGG